MAAFNGEADIGGARQVQPRAAEKTGQGCPSRDQLRVGHKRYELADEVSTPGQLAGEAGRDERGEAQRRIWRTRLNGRSRYAACARSL